MGDSKVPPIGPRIRAERERRNVTIRALARVIGVSPSLISQIDLFDASDSDEPATAPAPASTTNLRFLGTDRAKAVGPHVSPDDRELLTLDSGVTWERLGQVPHHHVDFLLVTYPPGSASSVDGRLMRHSGTEYGYLISGKLELNLGFDSYLLAAGDSVCFASTKPHGYRNDGAIPAVGVWFVVEPS
jgi:quercetin dioxygenase-like cupin family protein